MLRLSLSTVTRPVTFSFFRAMSKEANLNLSVLHGIAKDGKKTQLAEFSDYYGKGELKKLAALPTEDGYTPLHLAARYNTADVLAYFVNALGEDAPIVAKTVTNLEGKLPIMLIEDNKHAQSEEQKKEFLNIIRPSTFYHVTKPIQEKIDLKTLLNKYPLAIQGTSLYTNLVCAVEAANQTRSEIEISSSHPITNTYTDYEKILSQAALNRTHKLIQTAYFSLDPALKTAQNLHELIVRHSVHNKAANCDGYSHVTLYHLAQTPAQAPLEVYYCFKDLYHHIFNVIGRLPTSNSADFNTWGENAVVCDAQNGEIFLASEIPKKMKSWIAVTQTSKYGKEEVLGYTVVAYNSKYHELKSGFKLDDLTSYRNTFFHHPVTLAEFNVEPCVTPLSYHAK